MGEEKENSKNIVKIEMTNEEAKKILHCLTRTIARNNAGNLENILDTCEKIEKDIYSQIKW